MLFLIKQRAENIMRRPILLILYIQIALILVLYYLNPFGLGSVLDRSSTLLSHADTITSLSGIVTKVQIKEYYAAVTVDTGSEACLVRIKNITDEQKVYDLVGRTVTVQGKVSVPSGRRNLACFDYRMYLKGQGIYTIVETSKFRITGGAVKRPLLHFLSVKKASFYQKIRPIIGEEAFSVLSGILFGDKAYMDDELYDQFQTNGIAHILAVSGLHVSLLYSGLEKLLQKRKSLFISFLSVFLIYCYCALSGFCTSVIRASVMTVLKIFSVKLNRRYDSVCAATFAAILLLLFRPYLLFDSGFQLSFAAAYSMGVALPYIQGKFLKLSNRVRSERFYSLGSSSLVIIAAQIGMMPLIAFHFLNFSPISIFINPLAIYLASLILPLGLAVFLLSFFFSGIILAAAGGPAMFFLKALTGLSSLAAKLKFSYSVPAPPVHAIILYYIIFFYFFSETRIILNRRNKQKTLCLIASIIACFALLMPKGYNLPSLYFVDVGQGDCTLINQNGLHILIDGGGNYYKNIGKDTLKPFLLKNGITKIDLAIVSHKDQDHSKGIYELNECFKIEKILDQDNDNDTCIICSFYIEGLDCLFMADADKNREAALLKAYPALSCYVLKLGHHGSGTSSSEDFLRKTTPSFALISCGLNNSYGHPSPSVLQLLDKLGIIYARTDLYGGIGLKEVNSTEAVFFNAAKDKQWHIPLDK